MSSRPAVEVHGLAKSYGQVPAVLSLDFDIPGGTVLGFLGPNGAGKTTVIRILSTVIQADAGSFTLSGVPHTRPVDIRRRVGVLPESAGYPQGQTGEEWLTYAARLFGRSRHDARSITRRLLEDVGLADRAHSLVSGYSRGMRQRLGIARALVNHPEVLFLDEPTLGLDPFGQRQVLELVRRIAADSGVTVVLSTHLLEEVERTCDRVLILHRGRAVAQGSVAEVARRAAAPRRGTVQVPPGLQARAIEVLTNSAQLAAAPNDGQLGEVEVTIRPDVAPDGAARHVLRPLLDANVPVLGFTLEGGRLSDAFLAVTRDAP